MGFLVGHERVRRFEHEILKVGKWFMISKIVSYFLKIKEEFFYQRKNIFIDYYFTSRQKKIRKTFFVNNFTAKQMIR
jgi:hypothetical protein